MRDLTLSAGTGFWFTFARLRAEVPKGFNGPRIQIDWADILMNFNTLIPSTGELVM